MIHHVIKVTFQKESYKIISANTTYNFVFRKICSQLLNKGKHDFGSAFPSQLLIDGGKIAQVEKSRSKIADASLCNDLSRMLHKIREIVYFQFLVVEG